MDEIIRGGKWYTNGIDSVLRDVEDGGFRSVLESDQHVPVVLEWILNVGRFDEPKTFKSSLLLNNARVRGIDYHEFSRRRYYKEVIPAGWRQDTLDPNRETGRKQLVDIGPLTGMPIQGLDIHLFGEALSGLTHLLFRHELTQASNVHVFEGVRRSLDQIKLKYVVGADAWVSGLISKSIQMDFLVTAKARVAIKTVQRRGRIHDYMEQWGYRWIDAQVANPGLVRAMIFDPDIQEWDENSRAIGERHCEIFRPYFESELIQTDLIRLAA